MLKLKDNLLVLQVMELNSRLAEKNTHLREENELLQSRVSSGSQDSGRTKSGGLLGGIRSLGRRNSRCCTLPIVGSETLMSLLAACDRPH